MLRGPLEDGKIRISRVSGTYTFPADFMLIASMNPCPCGYFPDRTRCTCTNAQVKKYLTRISMPLLDRIDMCVEAHRVKYDELTTEPPQDSSLVIRGRVTAARAIQEERYRGSGFRFNADLNAEAVQRYCTLDADGEKMMRRVYEKMHLTARSYNRVLKTARTIADLSGEAVISAVHLAEAISYRAVDRKYWEDALHIT
jgi:magnesium chelatase family protein